MKNLFLLIISLSTFSLLAQSSPCLEVLGKFKDHYNNNDAQSIFQLMNASMKESIGLKKITTITHSFNTYYGKLTSYNFVEKKGTVEKYLGHFERGDQHISLATDSEGLLKGLLFTQIDTGLPGKLDRNITAFGLPFKGTWFTFWGGDNKRQNYHVIHKTQQGAFDFLILDKNNNSFMRSGTRNEDYYAFGKPVYALCDAIVVEVITGVEDNRPSIMNPAQASGNSVMLKTANDEFIVYSHFQKESINVAVGQRVKKGQFLAHCGNSGNSSEPHLHLHIMDSPNRLNATGARCYFKELMVNGELKTDYSPVKGDFIAPPIR